MEAIAEFLKGSIEESTEHSAVIGSIANKDLPDYSHVQVFKRKDRSGMVPARAKFPIITFYLSYVDQELHLSCDFIGISKSFGLIDLNDPNSLEIVKTQCLNTIDLMAIIVKLVEK